MVGMHCQRLPDTHGQQQ